MPWGLCGGSSVSWSCRGCGGSLVLGHALFSLTASVTFRIGLGRSFRESDLDNESFQELFHEVEAMLGSFNASEYFPFLGWIVDRFSGRFQRLERIFHELDNFFQHVIHLHLNPERTKQKHEDIIDVLLRVEREQSEFGAAQFTKDDIMAVLMNIFLDGVDTGAITMIWAMAELAKNPRLMKKMIIKETLRLHPLVPLLIPRETMSHFKINGYDIYPKMLLQVNAWGIGRDPKYWNNPEEFILERFIKSSTDYKGQNFELLPFGAGRRGCPGMYMATTTTIELALANLLYFFDWKLPDRMKEEDINMEESVGLYCLTTNKKKTSLNLVPIKVF
uniref:Cytochrome P450 n=1 Tax=Quercus lobata TaxID=97700 RepID=A0A7N2L888_QUELO